MKLNQWINRARSNDRGDATIELCLAIVVLLVLLGWMYAYGINRQAHQKVEHAAGEAARAASLSRTAAQANPSHTKRPWTRWMVKDSNARR
ncbi:hypothetical protein GCM10020255_002320 [Rhodococcus baikonurensis]